MIARLRTVLVAALFCLGADIAKAEKRVALVIGNAAYAKVEKLKNPANDAKEIGKFLNSASFEVIQATDLDHDEMIQVLQDFSAKIAAISPSRDRVFTEKPSRGKTAKVPMSATGMFRCSR